MRVEWHFWPGLTLAVVMLWWFLFALIFLLGEASGEEFDRYAARIPAMLPRWPVFRRSESPRQ